MPCRPWLDFVLLREQFFNLFTKKLYTKRLLILISDLKHNLLSISANALRTCLSHVGLNVSFVDIHKINSKCTPQQIMLYQIALNLHRVLNSDLPLTFEKISLLDQMVCGRRQLRFEVLRNFQGKIGMNTQANKFYHVSNMIGLDLLNLGFVHYKKVAKVQFLKFGNT